MTGQNYHVETLASAFVVEWTELILMTCLARDATWNCWGQTVKCERALSPGASYSARVCLLLQAFWQTIQQTDNQPVERIYIEMENGLSILEMWISYWDLFGASSKWLWSFTLPFDYPLSISICKGKFILIRSNTECMKDIYQNLASSGIQLLAK